MYEKWIKRIIDVMFSLLGLFFLFPFFLFLTFFLFFVFKANPFFIQPRVGKNKKIFKIYKFKTMTSEKGSDGFLLSDKQRLTSVGEFLRKTSLDEIPQLINVLLGDMSIVGPRPLLTGYMYLYSEFQDKRHFVQPGITGWVQVNGRNALSWDKRFELDVYYVENISFILDLKIIFKTVKVIFEKKTLNDDIPIEPFS
jgi:undecaprenyl phosphate N,N'-diacetylbacillosamine 1-phosphate transferase